MALGRLRVSDTEYPGIVIATLGPPGAFEHIVNDALRSVASRPMGRMLLQSIAHDGPQHRAKVSIRDGAYDWRTNAAVRANEEYGCWRVPPSAPGRGTFTTIYWNPNIQSTPDGVRPPFIGLAHELIHARRNLLGIGYLNNNRIEELHTVGLSLLSAPEGITPNDRRGHGPITENDIRREHGLTPRRSYSFPDGALEEEFEYLTEHF